jgi:hypothetical protein
MRLEVGLFVVLNNRVVGNILDHPLSIGRRKVVRIMRSLSIA